MPQRLKADLALGLCTLLWGATFVVVKEALTHASVFAFLAVRFLLATLLMAVIHRSAASRVTRAEIWAGAQSASSCSLATSFRPWDCCRPLPSRRLHSSPALEWCWSRC